MAKVYVCVYILAIKGVIHDGLIGIGSQMHISKILGL